MPEEINRIATDAISDLFFTTEKEGTRNLLAEGQPAERIHFVGHVMIDNLFYQLERITAAPAAVSPPIRALKERLGPRYACLTLHRPSNVDDPEILRRLLGAIHELARDVPIVFACHPRTRKSIETNGLGRQFLPVDFEASGQCRDGVFLTEPLGYNDFLYLWKDSTMLLTDSGGLQEETTALKVPCITLRTSTERPITAEVGSNEIAGTDPARIIALGRQAMAGQWKGARIPELWDGKASERIVGIIQRAGSD
jgi:UDP-N-acetylglucosamine 2-epimerase (non-hydrolysing)